MLGLDALGRREGAVDVGKYSSVRRGELVWACWNRGQLLLRKDNATLNMSTVLHVTARRRHHTSSKKQPSSLVDFSFPTLSAIRHAIYSLGSESPLEYIHHFLGGRPLTPQVPIHSVAHDLS